MGCPRCETEVEEWRALFVTLSGLASFEPSPGFADAVMARVAVRSAWAERLAAVTQWVTPRTTAAWALVAGLIVTLTLRDLWLLSGLRRCGLPWMARN